MAVLFDDTFLGPELLSAHVSDNGLTWTKLSVNDGSVATGLRSVKWPTPGFSLEARSAPMSSTSGQFVIFAEFDLHYTPGTYLGVFDFGVRNSSGAGVSNGFTIFPEGPLTDFGDGEGYVPVTGLIQGTNTMRIVVDIGTRNGEIWLNGSKLHDGQVIFSFAAVMPGSGGAYVAMSSDLDVKCTRLYIAEDGSGPTPVVGDFWTNLVKVAESP